MNNTVQKNNLVELARLIRYYILISTTEAGSGHPTSSLSAVELMTTLFFGGYFKFDLENIGHPNNDRLIFSKGHASPLFYALYTAAGKVSEDELTTFRKFGSNLEGHPTTAFPYTEAATGSLGQGLSIGLGMAMSAKYLDKLPYKTFILLGDSEMAEGSQWEAIQIAAHYKLNNLIGILDVNRLGQSTETMYGHNLDAYRRRIEAFDWDTLIIEDGHSFSEISKTYDLITKATRPLMVIAKTIKGKGFTVFEDKAGWHGKTLPVNFLDEAISELGEIDRSVRGTLNKPLDIIPEQVTGKKIEKAGYTIGQPVSTRLAYGNALVRIAPKYPHLVVMDAEVSNSTYTELFKKAYPGRYFEMFVAEQNMASAALGLARRGKIPFISTFAAFFSRAYDQIRMAQYSHPYANVKFAGTHCGVSIGEDGPSQMGLSDIAMFRELFGSVVLYPADAVSTDKLVERAAQHKGIVYLRLTRNNTRVIYSNGEDFPIGGSKVLKQSRDDKVTVVAAGVTLFEALQAYEELQRENINIRVIDLYSIKPLDSGTLIKAARETGSVITVEDHDVRGDVGLHS